MAIDRSRRRFIGTVAAGGTALVTSSRARAARPRALSSDTARPAVLGGPPVRTAPFPGWPVADAREEQALTNVVRSGKWWRGSGELVARFERAYAALTGAKHCLATANGTSSLLVALSALDIGPGDEVVVPPYTFVATINAVLALHALPVFVDTDVETFQIDAPKVAAAITERTRAILPVHLGGSPADLDTILAAASSKRVPVIEDACQAHLAEWRHRKVGTYGQAGCFSFQASKNLNSGEGGALLTNDDEFIETCYAFHNNSRGRRNTGSDSFSYQASGLNLRLTEMQAALLVAQMTRLEEQSRQRDTNAAHLTARLRDIPGILPARTYEGSTRNAYHLYMFRYDASAFAGLSRAGFLKALRAEGVPASGGYSPLDKEPFLARTLSGRGYQKIYGSGAMDAWRVRTRCPQNDRLCNEAVWFGQTMLLGSQSDTDQIADAVAKVQRHARDIASLSSEF
jgi:perosamine synthetase